MTEFGYQIVNCKKMRTRETITQYWMFNKIKMINEKN